MSPMKYQQLPGLISKLNLPAGHVQALGEYLRALRCGFIPAWIQLWLEVFRQAYATWVYKSSK